MAKGNNTSTALTIIRVSLAVLMFVHGAARISNGTVSAFGEFLSTQGLPLGFYFAWGITIFEIVGSVLLAAGLYTWIIALMFALQLAVGIALVHWKEGWFVVGAGRNGMEFSVLMIVSFLAIAFANYRQERR